MCSQVWRDTRLPKEPLFCINRFLSQLRSPFKVKVIDVQRVPVSKHQFVFLQHFPVHTTQTVTFDIAKKTVCLKNAGNCRSQSLPCTSRMVDHGCTAVSVINDEYLSVYYIQNIYSRLLYVSLEAFCLESRPIFFIRQIPSPERDSRRELIIIKVSLDDRRDSELSFHKLTFKHLLLCFVERRSNLLLPCNTV